MSCELPEMVIATAEHAVGVHCVDPGVIWALLGRITENLPLLSSPIGPMVPVTGVGGFVGRVGAALKGSGPRTKVMVPKAYGIPFGSLTVPVTVVKFWARAPAASNSTSAKIENRTHRLRSINLLPPIPSGRDSPRAAHPRTVLPEQC